MGPGGLTCRHRRPASEKGLQGLESACVESRAASAAASPAPGQPRRRSDLGSHTTRGKDSLPPLRSAWCAAVFSGLGTRLGRTRASAFPACLPPSLRVSSVLLLSFPTVPVPGGGQVHRPGRRSPCGAAGLIGRVFSRVVSEAPGARELEILVSQSRSFHLSCVGHLFRTATVADYAGLHAAAPGSFTPSLLASGEVSFLEVVLSPRGHMLTSEFLSDFYFLPY